MLKLNFLKSFSISRFFKTELYRFRYYPILKYLIFCQIVLTLGVSVTTFNNYKKRLQELLVEQEALITGNLVETFESTSEFLHYIGAQILKGNAKDSPFIYSILKDIKLDEYDLNPNVISWSFIGWVDSKGFQVVNQKEGIKTIPKDMNSMSYIKNCKTSPWKLQFSTPTMGLLSNMLIIPAGIGLTDMHKKFVGSLVVGFNVEEINKMLLKETNKNIVFQVVDEYGAIIFSNIASRINQNSENLFESHKLLSSPVTGLVSSTPYKVMVAVKQTIVVQDIIKYLSIALLINAIAYFAIRLAISTDRKKSASVAEQLDVAKKVLSIDLSKYSNSRAEEITKASLFLIKNFNIDIGSIVNSDEQIAHLILIIDNIENLNKPLPSTNSYQKINLNKIIDNALKINGRHLLEKNILLSFDTKEDLPEIYSDLLCIQLLLTGFISYAIEGITSGKELRIAPFLVVTASEELIQIDIKYYGLGIDIQDVERINSETPIQISNTSLPISYLKKLADLTNIKVHFSSTIGIGGEISLKIPLKSPPKLENIKFEGEKNVIHLNPKLRKKKI
jgi:hypothetical protein